MEEYQINNINENKIHPNVKALYNENDAFHEENQMMRKLVKD